MRNFEAEQVCAGAYRGKDVGQRTLLTHFIEEGADKTLCKRVLAERLCTPADTVSCPLCIARFKKLYLKGEAAFTYHGVPQPFEEV